MRSVSSASRDASSVPSPASGMSTWYVEPSGLRSTSIGFCISPEARAFALRSAIAARTLALVAALDRDDGSAGAAGERVVEDVERLQLRLALRQRVEPVVGRVQLQRRQGEQDQHTRRGNGRDHGVAQDGPQDRAPEPASLTVVAAQPVQERDPPLLDAVAELREHGRQHRERSDHGDGDDHHGADGIRHERLVAREQHPGHGDDDGEARDQDRTTGRRRGSFDRGPLASSGPPLVTLATEVEERVVDADGEPDQQDDLVDRGVHREELARQRDQARASRTRP